MSDAKDAKRWKFLLLGKGAVYPVYSEDGDLIGVNVETATDIWECESPEEVNSAMDIAIYRDGLDEPPSMH